MKSIIYKGKKYVACTEQKKIIARAIEADDVREVIDDVEEAASKLEDVAHSLKLSAMASEKFDGVLESQADELREVIKSIEGFRGCMVDVLRDYNQMLKKVEAKYKSQEKDGKDDDGDHPYRKILMEPFKP